ncbi:MAG: outer membrane protein assembly factor BamB [Betaproteobacteria bacterium]|nr:outer membrane protein assembly factor BamB [Betaproteobacteria bacterium]
MKSSVLLAAVALLAGCQTVYDSYDRVFGSQPAQKPAELTAFQPRAALRIVWQGSVGPAEKNVYFPARSGGVVYAVGAAGEVGGFDAASGGTVARFSAGQRVSGGVGAGNGMVLVGTARGEVLAFDRSGRALWKAQLSGEVLAPPEAQEGIVVARAGDGRVYGLDAASGKQKWTYQRSTPSLSVRTHAGLVVERGAVFVGFPGGRLVGLALASGAVGWEAVVALPRGATELERVADITSLPVVDGQRVCAVAFQGRVACFDALRGSPVWTRDVSSIAGLAVDERYLYVTDDKNAVLAFDKASGSSIWRQDKLAGRRVSGPLAIGRYVAVGDLEGYVHLLSRDDGAFAARIATDGSAIAAPPMALDTTSFLVQTRNGGVFAITIQ